MECTLCYKKINEVEARESCSACFLTGGCKMIKCPNCGYEMPLEASWAKKVVQFFSFDKKRKRA